MSGSPITESLVASLRPCFLASNSFPCHTCEKSHPKSNYCHTSKIALFNPCGCHTSETPRGVTSILLTRHPTKGVWNRATIGSRRTSLAIVEPAFLAAPFHESQVTNHESAVTFLFPELTFHLNSSQMVIRKDTASLDPTTNEHPRRHYRQAHQDQRRARRANRHARRHSHLWTGCPQFRRVRAGSGSQPADSSRPALRAIHYSHQRGHHHAAGHRLLFVSPDDRCLSNGRRFVYRGALQPGRLRGLARGGGFADGLHPYSSGGHFRRGRRVGFRHAIFAAAHGFVVCRDSYRHHHPESARRARCRSGVHGADISFCRHAAHYHRWRAYARGPQWRASRAHHAAAASTSHHRSRHAVAPAESFRQRLHRADRRGGRQQWRESFPRTRREKRAVHADGHYFSAGCPAGGNFVSRQSLRHSGHRPGPARLPEPSLHVDRRGFRQRRFLLSDDRLDSLRTFTLREYRVRGFSASVPFHFSEQLSAACVRIPWPPPGLYIRNRGSRRTYVLPAGCFRGRDGQTDSALRRGRFPGLYAFAIRNGGALAEKPRPALDEERFGERPGRIRDRHHRDRGACREVCRRRMDHRYFHSTFDPSLSHRAPSLPHGQRGYELPRAGGPRQRSRASHCCRAFRALEPDFQAGARICLAAISGNRRRPRRARRPFGIPAHGLETLRGTTLPSRRRRAPEIDHSSFALSLHHRSHRSIHSRSLREESRPEDCGGHSPTGGGPLVRILPAQPARPLARMDAAGPWQPAYLHRTLALLPFPMSFLSFGG